MFDRTENRRRNQLAQTTVNWKVAATILVVVWLAAMIAASYYSYSNRDPVRIENWKPEPR